ncbi:MAG: hypothetical protein ABFD60_06980 [Bryobacteraceae bacterium]
MKVKFKTSISSSVWGAFVPGESGEVPDAEAEHLIAAGLAERADGDGEDVAPPEIETAARKAPRKAAKR